MKTLRIAKVAGLMAAAAIMAAPQAKADLIFDLSIPNSSISTFTGPYAQVDVHLVSSTEATITFTAYPGFQMTDGSSAAVNVNGSFSLASFSSTPSLSLSDSGSGNADGFGGFNQRVTDGNSSPPQATTIILTIDATGLNSWGSATAVLTPNANGYIAAAHIGVLNDPNNPNSGFGANTGFAGNGNPVPEPTTMIAGALLLLPFGASTLRVLRNRKA